MLKQDFQTYQTVLDQIMNSPKQCVPSSPDDEVKQPRSLRFSISFFRLIYPINFPQITERITV